MENLIQYLKLAIRQLRHSPSFTGSPYPCAFYRGKHRDLFDCERAPLERVPLRSSGARGDNLCPDYRDSIL